MSRQTAISNVNSLILKDREEENKRKRDHTSSLRAFLEEAEKEEEEERQRQRNASSVGEVMDLVRGMGNYGLERRAAEMPQPVKEERQTLGPNALTPEMEARRQAAAGVNRAPTAYQTYMMQVANSQPTQEETRSTDELRRDMNRQNRIARGTERMASDMGSQMLQDQSLIYNPTYTSNLRTMGQTMEAQQAKADQATELYQTLSVQRREQEEREKYAALMSNPDFVAKSQGDPTIGNKTSATSLAPAERLYQKIFHRNDTKDANGNIKDAAGSDAARFVNDEEAAIFYYLWNTQGAKAAQSYYYGYVENRAGERRAQLAQQQAQAYGEYDPVGASIARVGYNAMSGIGLVDMALQNLTRTLGITDRNKPLNYNSDAQLPGQVADALQSGASNFVEQFAADEIKRINPNVKHPENYAKVASFLYQTGMSMADSSVAIALNLMGIPEPLTLANMGAAAGTRAIREARERGATDGQALAFGFSSAIMEALFEKISLDRILEPSYATNWKQHFLNAWKQSFTEGSEEVMTTLANTAADMLIMGDKAELSAIQRRLMEQGVSEKEALAAAFKQWGTGIIGDLLGGMISGFGMGGVKEIGAGLNNLAQGVRQDMQTARALTDYQNAQQAAPQIAPMQAPAAPAQQRQLTAREQNPLQFAMNKAQNGETVTGNDAKAILNDPQAMQTLRDAGVLAETIRPGAEGRAQIQQAVQALAEQSRAEMPESQQTTERTSQLPVQNQQGTTQERTTPPLPRQMAQEQQERVTTPPVPQNAQEAAQEPTLRLRAQEEQAPGQETLRIRDSEVAEPTRQAPLTIRGANATVEENRQEVDNNVDIQPQTQAASDSEGNSFYARARQNAAGRQSLDGSERRSGVGRLLQDLRNYRTVRGAESRATEAERIRTDSDVRNQREVSAKELGVGYGTDNKTARLLDNEFASRKLGRNWDRAVAEYAKMGVKLQAITGQLERQLPGGQLSMVRAYVSGDGKTITVQVDHPTLTWNQLLDHEETHRLIKEDAAYKKAVQEALLADEKLKPYLADILRRYNEKYNEVDPNMTADEVAEEMLADYRAGFDMLDPLGMNPTTAKAAKVASKDIKGVEKERYKTNGGRPAPREITETFAEGKNSVEPPYRFGTKALADFEESLSPEARKTYDLFKRLTEISRDGTAVITVGSGKAAHLKRDTIADKSFFAKDWNKYVKNNEEFAETARKLVAALPQSVKDFGHFNDDGTITPTEFEENFKMNRSFVQRVVDALPKNVVQPVMTIDGHEYRISDNAISGAVGGEEYRQAILAEKRRLYKEGKLPTVSVGSLSHDNWGAMGFLATNTKTGASGDFTTFCPQMYFNNGCFYCYRRAALTSGSNNKLTGETVWYSGEILQLTDKDKEALNKRGGLRIQSFGDWQDMYTPMLADMLYDAQLRGLQIKIITKEPSMIETVARLRKQALGLSLYFNLSADYTIERRGESDNREVRKAAPLNAERPFLEHEWLTGEPGEDIGWKRALSVQEANEYRKKYSWVNTRIVATTLKEYLRGLIDPTVDVVTGYHGKIKYQERVSSETGETLIEMEALGDSGMPQFKRNEQTGEWEIARDKDGKPLNGKNHYQKELCNAIVERGLQEAYYAKACCITGRCAECQGLCGGTSNQMSTKNATNRDADNLRWVYLQMEAHPGAGMEGNQLFAENVDLPEGTTQAEDLVDIYDREHGIKPLQEKPVDQALAERDKWLAKKQRDAEKKAARAAEGKASTEIDTDYLAAVNSGDMETAQRMVDEAAKKAGYTVRKYHQTNVPNIHVFDIGIGTHGGTDSETPYGIFTKNTRADIGLGDIQMSLYLKPGKTFVINSRDELRSRMPEAYNLLATKLEAIDEKYDALVEEAEDALFDAQDAYEEKHPEAEVTLDDIVNNRTYDDPACQRANEHWKAVMAEWSQEADKIRVQAKEVLSKYLRDSGYDSMEIKLDKGTNGRSTDTFIVFSPEQVKSADPVTYDDKGKAIPLSQRFNTQNEDTRYSIEIDPEVAAQFSPEAIARRQSNRTKGVKGERKVSRVRSNTYEYSGLYNEVEAQMDEADEENYTYDPVSEKKSMNEALGRLKADFDGEVSRLSEADRQWGGSDLDTAMGILHRYRTEGRATGDYGDFWRWSKVIQEKGTKGGQFIQAFAKYTRTGTGAAMKGAKDIHDRFKLNPAQQKQVDAAKKKLMDGIDGDMNGAAQDAMKQAKGQKEPGKKQDGKVDKKKLDAEIQRRKDAERLVREISKLFEKQQNHGEPVENWLNLTGEELARKIAGRFSEPKQRAKTTMQTILSDLVGFAEEHALPDRKKAEGTKRTAIDIITDYLNNRDAYGTAWAAAQSYLRATYTDDQEKLDALNSFLTATIAYNAEGTDRTMLDAILQSADVLGISEKRILELTSAGATASTIDRIGDELVSQVKERMGADYDEGNTQQLKDAVRRHITGIALQESAEDQRLRLGRMTTDAARQLELNLQKLLTQSRGDKNRAAQSVADYLIRELGIPSSDAAIAAERITGAFTDELASRADRKLQQMFAEKKPKTQEQRDRLLDLIRLGGLTNSNVEDAVVDALGIGGMSRERQRELVGVMAQFGETLDAMEADDLDGLKGLIRAQAAVRNTPLSRQAEKTLAGETDAQYLREFALAQLDAIAGDFAEMSPGAKISTFQTISHLLNMRTALRNLTSNQVFDLVDSAANNLATIPDMVIGAFTGKRTVGVNKSWLSEMKRAGAKQGAARNALEVRLDVSPDDRQKTKYGTAGRRTNSMAASNAFGRILSHLEEVMGYELNTTDEFHKGSVRGETLESLARFVERGDITQEQANAWAEEEALYRSFQDDTLVGNIMGELKTLLNVIGFGDSGKTNSRGRTIHDFGLGDLVVKYTQVPGALIHRGIEYSPLGYAKMLYDLAIAKDSLVRTQKRGEDVANAQRKLALDIGRATTGSGLITLFAVLAKAGLLRRDDDDKDKNAKAIHAAQGLSGTQLNLTALKRWIEGGDLSLTDGDVLADIGFLEPLDSLMTIATLMANDDDLKLADIGVKSLDGVWKAISNTSAMQTISNIISTVQYHDEENDLPLYFQIPIEIASDSISGFVPSPVRQLAQATDTTYRDQYRSKSLNDQVRAKVMNSVPGVRQMLAPKITPLGEDKKYQKPLLNYLNATLNPGNINVYQASDVVDELNRVYGETDDAKIWPERNAPYSFTANDEKWTLTPDERTQYQRTRGQTTAKAMESVIGTDWYKTMSATGQAEVLNWIGNLANFVAKKEMLEARGQEYGSNTYDKYYDAWQSGTPIEDVVADKYGKLIKVAEETAAAETIIAEAKIPEASKEEAETMSADAKRFYAGFLKGGVSDETARKLATELDGSEASGHEQWRMVYDAAGKEGEKAVTAVMTDDMKRNWELAKNAGVSMDDYIKVREGFKDLNGNGKQTQDEWNATLDSFTFSTNTAKDKSIKGTLWQILTGSGSTKNNPYDKEAGQKVLDAKSGGGSGSGSYAPARIPALRIPEVPKATKPSSGLRIKPV